MSEHENCHVEPVEKTVDAAAMQMAEAAILGVSGMGCPRCATRVKNGLIVQNGVVYVDVFLENGVAAVAYNPAEITPADLVTAVANAGNDGRHHYQAEILQRMPANEAFRIPA